MTPIHDSTLNSDLELWSKFNVEFWPGVIIQRGTLTWGHKSTWNFDPGSQFNVEFWPVCISSTRGIATQEGVKIQQRDQNSTAKEGHNSTKNPLNIDPGSVFNEGVKILSYTGMPNPLQFYRNISECGKDVNYNNQVTSLCGV